MAIGSRKKEILGLKKEIEDLRQENTNLKSLLGTIRSQDNGGYTLSAILNVMESANMGVMILIPGQANLQLSSKALDILGMIPSEAITLHDLQKAILLEDRMIFEKALAEAEKAGKRSELELKIARADVEGREFRIVMMHMDRFQPETGSSDTAVICILTDITAYDKVRRDLMKAREKAEDRERNKNMLLRYLSHEIRTPINAIIGYSELLHIGNLSSDKRHEYVSIIKDQGIYLHRLIDDMAEFARMETGKVKISKSPCNMELLLHEVLAISNQHKTISNKDQIDIRVEYPSEREIITYTDPGRLQQLIVNLVRHSINLTTKGDIEIGYQIDAENRVEIHVQDSSTPASREKQKKSYADELTFLGKYESPGFELTIAKSLAKVLGGKMWTETLPEKGLNHFCCIPYEEVPETYHEAMPEDELVNPPYSWKDKLILIVEDDDVNYKFLETVLQDTDVQLLRAVNGSQAVELCRSSLKIDIVLMDIKLPDLNGLEASRKIREFNRKIPIVAQSAFIMEDEKDAYLQAGINDHIDKPINIRDFYEKLDGFLKES